MRKEQNVPDKTTREQLLALTGRQLGKWLSARGPKMPDERLDELLPELPDLATKYRADRARGGDGSTLLAQVDAQPHVIRILLWTRLTSGEDNSDLEWMRWVHRALCRPVMEAFGIPAGSAGVGLESPVTKGASEAEREAGRRSR